MKMGSNATKRRNQYYLKDKKIKIVLRAVENRQTYYQYATEGALWAYASQLRQDLVYEARTWGSNETRFFVINNRDDVKLYDLIEYRERFYTITRIDTKDDYNGDMFVYVMDTPRGDIPKEIVQAMP